MAEPQTRAAEIEALFPWLLHWSISDERLGGFRSDAYAVEGPDGLLLIDPLPVVPEVQDRLREVAAVLLTHGNHQRSAWRLRAELEAPVYAPSGAPGLDEEPDVWFDDRTALPGGLRATVARGFQAARYLTYAHADGTAVLFCGDLLCQDPGGPLRFPVQPGYFDRDGGEEDARRLLEVPVDVICAAHAEPTLADAREALQNVLRADA